MGLNIEVFTDVDFIYKVVEIDGNNINKKMVLS